jgi:CXXC-20-CXXC protein
MNVIGDKNCCHCNEAIKALDGVLAVFSGKQIVCEYCGNLVVFDKHRRWLALGATLVVIIVPTVLAFNYPDTFLNTRIMYLKYLLAVLVFFAINGTSHVKDA